MYVYVLVVALKIAEKTILAVVHNSSIFRPSFLQEDEVGHRNDFSKPWENGFYVQGTIPTPFLSLR